MKCNPFQWNIKKQSTPDNASGSIKILIHGLNLSPDFPIIQRSGKDPIIGSLIASHNLATKNNVPIHPALIPNTLVQKIRKYASTNKFTKLPAMSQIHTQFHPSLRRANLFFLHPACPLFFFFSIHVICVILIISYNNCNLYCKFIKLHCKSNI